METKRAFNKLLWRFKSGKNFTPNNEDKDALNTLIRFFNRQQSETIKNNQILAKLYIYVLNQELNHFNSVVIDNIVQRKLHKLLDTPLESFYHAFWKDMQHNQINRVVEDKKENITEEDLRNAWKEQYSLETVTGYLDEMIFKSLNKLS